MDDFVPKFWRAMTDSDTGRRLHKPRRLGAIDLSFDVIPVDGPGFQDVLREIEVGLSARTRLHLQVSSKYDAEAMRHARQNIADYLMGDVSAEIMQVIRDLTATGTLDYGDPRIRHLMAIVAGIEFGRGEIPDPAPADTLSAQRER